MSWSSQRAELPQQGGGDRFLTLVDDDTLRRAPHSQESSEHLQTHVPRINKRTVHVACAPNQRVHPETAVSTHRGKLLTGRDVPETGEL